MDNCGMAARLEISAEEAGVDSRESMKATPSKGTEETYAKYDNPAIAQSYHERRYADYEGRLNLWAMRRALGRALAHIPSRGRVLDVPCGTGQYAWHLAALGFHTLAADLAPEMVKVAATSPRAKAIQQPRFVVENIFHLSFPTGSFDGAVCIRLFNLLDRAERVAALRELRRVAATVIVSYNLGYTLNSLGRLFRYKFGLRGALKPLLSAAQFKQEISEAGLNVRALIAAAPLFSEIVLAILESHGPVS